MRRDLIVIGTSLGGVEALQRLVRPLPGDISASMCVVMHLAADSPGILDHILRRAGKLRVRAVETTERIAAGTIYLPKPDHHLIVEPSRLRVTRGPTENRFRPAIDPMFRSAAQVYGPRVIGVILTGALDDGAAGLWAVKRMGGIAIVQDPADALYDSMPRSALDYVAPDYCVPLDQIPALLQRLSAESIEEAEGYTVPEEMKIETSIASDTSQDAGVERIGPTSTFACPECNGVLYELKEGDHRRFRCHTGHAYSIGSLIAEYDQAIEQSLWRSLRSMQEQVRLLGSLADHFQRRHGAARAASLHERAAQIGERRDSLRRILLDLPDKSADAANEVLRDTGGAAAES